MGDHGANAGGFAYMPRVICPRCGLNHVVSNRNHRANRWECGDEKRCAERAEKRAMARPDQKVTPTPLAGDGEQEICESSS